MSLTFKLYSIYKRIFHHVIVFIFWLYNKNKKKVVPGTNNEILHQSAVSLARQIKSSKLKSLTVVEAFIQRINEVNPLINALIDQRFDEALNEAKQIDEKFENGSYTKEDLERLVYLGVPFTCKESTHCKGLSSTFGLVCRKGMKAESDADVVSLMKSAGAILLGVCNVPEINMWLETYNPLFGKTNNPYDTTRNVGGSTGGDAALIASSGIPISLGTDIAGSVRIPSFRCGIFGHKPTNDLISTRGLTYRDGKEGPTMCTPGPLSKKSEDLLPMLTVLTRNSPKLNLDKEVDITKVRILYTTSIECFLNGPIGKESKDSVRKCINYFEGYSETRPKQVRLESLNRGLELWFYSMSKEKGSYRKALKNLKSETTFLQELFKYLKGAREHTIYTLYFLYKLTPFNPDISKQYDNLIENAREELMRCLGEDAVLIIPSEAHTVGYHYTSLLELSKLGFYSIFNILKFPVTQVPVGLNSEGIPLGVQVVATPFNDRLTIAVANELEKAFGGYAQPIISK